jgi:LuxR family maltose regulon positive regulatory protein
MSEAQQSHYFYESDLLRTKLSPPRLAAPIIHRDGLLARLDEGLSRKLTSITAPAGFGKTTLVAGWLAEKKVQAAWVSLEAADSDPIRFWRYVVAACQTFAPAIDRTVLPLLGAAQRTSIEPFLTAVINQLAGLDGLHILVLDDYHTLVSDEIHRGMAFVLAHLPETLHIVLAGRSDPLLPLGRLRARNELNELHANDLRFTQAEMSVFFEKSSHLALSPELVEHLEQRTEGWGAGLRLIVLALEGRRDPEEIERFLATFGGDQKHLADYLVGDVLASLPEDIQQFMLQTAALSRFTASLCDDVTRQTGGQSIIDRLERDNLFLVPLGHENAERWYRYHPLFCEAVASEARQRLGQDSLYDIFRRASHWYEKHGLLVEAVESALDGESYQDASRLIDHLREARSFYEPYTLRRWIERLPDGILASHPGLAFAYASSLLHTMDRYHPATAQMVEGPLQLAEECWQRAANRPRLGAVMAFRAGMTLWQNGLARGFALAHQALDLLGETPDDIYWRGIALSFIGIEDLLNGHIDHAEQAIMEAYAIAGASQDRSAALGVMLQHARAYVLRGQNHPAAQLYQQVIDEAVDREDPSNKPYALFGMGNIHYEWNELAQARQSAETALRASQKLGDDRLMIDVSLLLARIDFSSGQTGEAQHRLDMLVTSAQWPTMRRKVQAWQARFSLWSGDIAGARRLLDVLAGEGIPAQRMQHELEDLSQARLEIALGRAQEALARLSMWQADAQAEGRTRSEIEILIVRALAYASLQDNMQALASLAEALDLSQMGDHRRLFVDEGQPMVALLKTMLAERDEPYASYARVMLHAVMQAQMTQPEATTELLIEPLSAQELRVLRLLTAGLSNADIAGELVVSVNTIKTQLKSIYHKLSVRSREEACDAARDLHLV